MQLLPFFTHTIIPEIIPAQSSLEWALAKRRAMDIEATARDPALSSSYYDTAQRPAVPYGTNPYMSFTQTLVQDRKTNAKAKKTRPKARGSNVKAVQKTFPKDMDGEQYPIQWEPTYAHE